VTGTSLEGVRSLLEAPSPAVLTTYRTDGSVLVSPVWFRWSDGVFEVVIAKGDIKLRHLAHDPRCVLVVFEDRLGALDGVLRIESAPGSGTMIEGRLPIS
jgi:hypothetical protein